LRAKRAEIFLVCTGTPIVTEHLSEAEADILALHRLNLYPFIIVFVLHILSLSVVRGVPFPVGALSVCLWVNLALVNGQHKS